jgi:ABC-type transport system substrate-binding protein
VTSRVALSRRLLCAAALAGLAAACVAACGGAGASNATSSAGQAAHTFIDLVDDVPLDIDETATPDSTAAQLLPTWSSELVRPAPAAPGPHAQLPGDDAVVPYLATAWQRAANGSYTFELRQGVRGVSGDPFTSADVKWSLERALARSPVAPFLFQLAHIDTTDPVTILGRYSVRVNVTSPSPFTLSVLASYDSAIYDSALYRSHATAADPWAQQWGASHSASFGAYWVAGFQPGREIVLNANPGFWRRPYYTRVLIREVSNSSSRLADVLTGAADHTSDLTWQEFQEAINVGAADGVSASVLQTGPGVIAWHLNVSKGPLANQQVREALSLGVDRVDLAEGIDEGFDAPSAMTIPAAFGGTQPADFNGPQARSLLRAAGYPPGALTINVYLNGDDLGGVAQELLGFLYQDMVQIGVNLNMTYVEDPDQLLSLEQHSAVESTIDADTPLLGGAGFLIEETANAKLDPASPAVEQGYSDPTLQGVLDQLASSPGGSATTALIQQAAQLIDGAEPTVNFAAIPVQNVTRSNITGYAAYTDPVTYYENLHPTG